MILLGVCHTVVIEEKNGKRYYSASSPDELALVNCAKYFNISFEERDESNNVIMDIFGERKIYHLLNVIEFTSGRKRMTVIVKCPDGKIKVMCKGADSIILPRLSNSPANQDCVEVTNEYLEYYAKDGLRTLLVGEKEITEQ